MLDPSGRTTRVTTALFAHCTLRVRARAWSLSVGYRCRGSRNVRRCPSNRWIAASDNSDATMVVTYRSESLGNKKKASKTYRRNSLFQFFFFFFFVLFFLELNVSAGRRWYLLGLRARYLSVRASSQGGSFVGCPKYSSVSDEGSGCCWYYQATRTSPSDNSS